MATVVTPMTTEELLAIPEDGVRRWLIDGELRESPVTVRNRFHSRATICVGTELELWLRQQPTPRGQIIGGEAGVRILHDPDTTVGVDVAYVSHEVIAKQTDESTLGRVDIHRRNPNGINGLRVLRLARIIRRKSFA